MLRERSTDSAVSVMKGICVVFTVLIADVLSPAISGLKTLCRGHMTCGCLVIARARYVHA
jgi:hypothetical protein